MASLSTSTMPAGARFNAINSSRMADDEEEPMVAGRAMICSEMHSPCCG